jgi:hypothetical protein
VTGSKWLAAARASHTRALGAVQMFPLTGDGEHVGTMLGRRLADGATDDSYAGPELAAARYRDWLAAQRSGAVETRAFASAPAPDLVLRPEEPGAVQTRITLPARQHRSPAADVGEALALLRGLVDEFGALFPDECAAAAAFLARLA